MYVFCSVLLTLQQGVALKYKAYEFAKVWIIFTKNE